MTIEATAPAADTTPAPSGSRHLLPIFAGLLVAMFLAALDQTIFSTALPTIVGDLHGVDQMLWVTTAYLVAATIMMPIYGKLGDLIGRKSLLIIALSIFVGGSFVGALSQDMTMLIIGRAVQGLGGGGLMLLAQAIIADVVPARQRGRYMGVMGAVFGLSSVVGPLLGGWFTESLTWRVGFWLNVPLGIVAILAAAFFLKLPKHDQRPNLDVFGILTMAVGVTALILATSWGGNTYDWTSWQVLGLFGITVLFGAIFVLVERKAKEPIIPLHLFAQRNFNLTTIAGLIIAIAMFGVIGYMPTYLQMSTGVSATVSGLMLIPMVAGLLTASIIAGQIVTRTGRYKWAPILSTIIVTIGVLLLSRLTVDTPVVVLMSYIFVLGAGIGVGMQNLILIVQNTFPNRELGTATAANNFFRQIGASLGSSIVGSVFTSRLTTLLSDRLPAQAAHAGGGNLTNTLTPNLVKTLPQHIQNIIVGAYNDALTPIFLYLAPVVVVALILVLFIREKPLATTLDSSSLERSDTEGWTGRLPASPESPDVVALPFDRIEVDRIEADRTAAGVGELATTSVPAGASVDVLSAARGHVQATADSGDSARERLAGRVDQVSRQIDETIGTAHRQLERVRHELAQGLTPTAAGEQRDHEAELLRDSQAVADQVVRQAGTEAEQVLVDADHRRAALDKEIAELRAIEQELSARISERLREDTAATAEAEEPARGL